MTVRFDKALPREIQERVLQLSRADNLDYMDELVDIIETGLRVREAGMMAARPAQQAAETPQAQQGSAAEFIEFLFSMPNAGKDSDYDRHAGNFPDYDADATDSTRHKPGR